MKKFNIKTLLILVLTLILVFTLVACNKNSTPEPDPDPDPIDPNAIEPTVFFDNLWNAASSIGSEEIKPNDDIAVGLDLGVKIKVQDVEEKVYEEIALGVALQLIYGRNDNFADKAQYADYVTAVKVKLYNSKTNANWLTAYYFFKDPENLYLDYQGQNIKFSLDANGANYDWAGYLNGFMTGTKLAGDLTLSDILTMVTNTTVKDTTGKGFDLNKLIAVVLDIVKAGTNGSFDLNSLLNQYGSTIESLGVTGLVNNDGTIDLSAIFKSTIIAGFLENTRCVEENGVKNYSTTLTTEGNLLGTLLGGLLGDYSSLISGASVGIQFGVKENHIDGFKLVANLPGCRTTIDRNNVWPVVEIAINDLSFGKFDKTASTPEKVFGIDTTKYSPEVSLDIAVELDSNGAIIHPGKVNEYSKNAVKDLDIAGAYTLRVQANGNLDGKDDFYIYAYFAKGAKDSVKDSDKAIQIAYSRAAKKVVISLNDEVKAGDASIVEAIVDSFGPYLLDFVNKQDDENIKYYLNQLVDVLVNSDGTYKDNAPDTYTLGFDVDALVDYLTVAIGKMIVGEQEAEIAAVVNNAYAFKLSSLVTAVKDVVNSIDTQEGTQIGVSLPGTLMKLMKSWFTLTKNATDENWYTRAIAYNANWYDTFKQLGYTYGADQTYAQATTYDKDETYYLEQYNKDDTVINKDTFIATKKYYTMKEKYVKSSYVENEVYYKKYSEANITEFAKDTDYYTLKETIFVGASKYVAGETYYTKPFISAGAITKFEAGTRYFTLEADQYVKAYKYQDGLCYTKNENGGYDLATSEVEGKEYFIKKDAYKLAYKYDAAVEEYFTEGDYTLATDLTEFVDGTTYYVQGNVYEKASKYESGKEYYTMEYVKATKYENTKTYYAKVEEYTYIAEYNKDVTAYYTKGDYIPAGAITKFKDGTNYFVKVDGMYVEAASYDGSKVYYIKKTANKVDTYEKVEIVKFADKTTYYTLEPATCESITKEKVENMWTIAKEYFADGANKANVLNKYGLKNDEDSIKAMDKLDLFFGDRFISFDGITGHWYEILFTKMTAASAVIKLDNGLSVKVDASLQESAKADVTAKATLSVEINAIPADKAPDFEAIFNALNNNEAVYVGPVVIDGHMVYFN